MKKMQNNRGSLILLTAVIIGGLLLIYYKKSAGFSQLNIDQDRSNSYNLKVLPNDLDDAGLAALPPESFSYLAMIDAGSSGCRSHVYRYGKLGSIDGPLYVLPQHNSKKVKPGLSSFASNPSDAGVSLAGLVDFIKEQVPQNAWGDTPIWLKATAGLRMLEESQSNAILNSVRAYLNDDSKSPFLFRDSFAKIISGNEEGGFGWIAFNYLKKIIGPKKNGNESPFTVVEMGGASAQVSQLAPSRKDADAIPLENRFTFTIEGETYTLYTHSYLGYGAEQGREGLNKMLTIELGSDDKEIKDPCLNSGYTRDGASSPRKEVYEGASGEYKIVGASDKAGVCQTAVNNLFVDNKSCEGRKGPFSFNCVTQPDFVVASKNFLVFENFYYISSATGVLPANHAADAKPGVFPLITTSQEYAETATQVCSTNWDGIQKTYPLDNSGKDNNVKWCYSASYASAFLTKGLHVPADKQLTVQKEVDGSEIEWALGAAYKEAADLLKRTNLRPQ